MNQESKLWKPKFFIFGIMKNQQLEMNSCFKFEWQQTEWFWMSRISWFAASWGVVAQHLQYRNILNKRRGTFQKHDYTIMNPSASLYLPNELHASMPPSLRTFLGRSNNPAAVMSRGISAFSFPMITANCLW